MQIPQFAVWQGTDFSLEVRLPYELASGDAAVATLSQGFVPVLEYRLNVEAAESAPEGRIVVDSEDAHVLRIEMTQADTLQLAAGEVELQVRVRTDEGAETFAPVLGMIGAAANRVEL